MKNQYFKFLIFLISLYLIQSLIVRCFVLLHRQKVKISIVQIVNQFSKILQMRIDLILFKSIKVLDSKNMKVLLHLGK
jgi:hypothetical protein